jgi:hypothetical protein
MVPICDPQYSLSDMRVNAEGPGLALNPACPCDNRHNDQ